MKHSSQNNRIGELARSFQISSDTLHLYEERGLLHPQRMENGYRSYSRADVILLDYIRRLRDAEISLEEIGELLQTDSLDRIAAMMHRNNERIYRRIQELERIHRDNELYERDVLKTLQMLDHYEISYSPRFIYHRIGNDFMEIMEKFRTLPGSPEPYLAFLTSWDFIQSPEYEEAVRDADPARFITDTILLVTDRDGQINVSPQDGFKVVESKKCLLSGQMTVTGQDYSSILRYNDYIRRENYQMNGDRITICISLQAYKKAYYQVWQPII